MTALPVRAQRRATIISPGFGSGRLPTRAAVAATLDQVKQSGYADAFIVGHRRPAAASC